MSLQTLSYYKRAYRDRFLGDPVYIWQLTFHGSTKLDGGLQKKHCFFYDR